MHVDGLILAGGAGRRMGGEDKGLLTFNGRTLVAHAIARLRPQVEQLYLSANRNLPRYAALDFPVLTDLLPDLPGPLAGLHAGLAACNGDILVCVPCDTPGFPVDLVSRLIAGLSEFPQAPATWAITAEREHPVFMACRRSVLPKLEDYLQRGERRVGGWLHEIGAVPVVFPDEAAFANFNTPEALAAMQEAPPPAGPTPSA